MKLYDKLKNLDLVEDYKEYFELIMTRNIRINDKSIDDPKYELKKEDTNIKIGILSIDY